ncbi:MAG TPA: Fe-S cluster assembly ATPase SufC [Candidatus Dojkabacteria bacterium]
MKKDKVLELKRIKASIESQEILKGVDLKVTPGKIHYLMGKNGAGKSTIAKIIMGHPDYEITEGSIEFDGEDITEMGTNERSIKGIYLANQYPIEVPGVNLFNFLRIAYNARLPKEKQLSVFRFKKILEPILEILNMDKKFLERNLNEGFSGGEKKKCEILQMAVLDPDLVILDETDSGLDVDSLKEVFSAIAKLKERKPEMTLILITHYNRISTFLPADEVHVLRQGIVVKSGGAEIAKEIDEKGYLE